MRNLIFEIEKMRDYEWFGWSTRSLLFLVLKKIFLIQFSTKQCKIHFIYIVCLMFTYYEEIYFLNCERLWHRIYVNQCALRASFIVC